MSMWRRYGFALPAVVLLSALLAPAARGDLSPDLITATSVLTPAQQQSLDETVHGLVDRLVKGTDAEVTKARSDLLDPFEKAPSDIFRIAYSASLVRYLPGAMGSTRAIVRINSMLVAARLVDTGAVKLVQTALTDANPGVRYWAAKAMGQLARAKVRDQPLLSASEQSPVLEALAAAAAKEASPDALQQELIAMSQLTIAPAALEVLKSLNTRVDAHAADPAMPLTADTEGLYQLWARLVAEAAGRPTDPGVRRQMALASYRYMTLVADQLSAGKLSPELQVQAWAMIETTDAALRWALADADASVKPPPGIKEFVGTRSAAGVKLRNEQNWRPLLMTPPFNFKADELAVPAK